MKASTYQDFVRIGNFTKGDRDSMFLAALGLNGEAAEIAEQILGGDRAAIELFISTGAVSERVKKHLLHGKDLDRDALKKELGDVLWYLVHACNAFGYTIDEVMAENVAKLCDRYPDQYGSIDDWLESKPSTGDIRSDLGLTADGHPPQGYADGQAAGGFLDTANEMTS